MIDIFLEFLDGFNFTVEEFKLIVSKMEKVTLKRHEFLLQHGKPCDHLYFIGTGLIRGYVLGEDGREKTLWVHSNGRFTTDYKAFLNRSATTIMMDALQDSTIFRISWNDLQYLYKAVPEFNTFGRVTTEQYFIKLIDEIRMLQSNPSPLMRYEVFMGLHEGIAEQVPQHMIADIINVSPVHFSRLKSTYAKKTMKKSAEY